MIFKGNFILGNTKHYCPAKKQDRRNVRQSCILYSP